MSLFLFVIAPALASSTGKTGSSTTGCGSCHGARASASTTATLAASDLTVAPGGVVSLTMTVANAGATFSAGGLDVSVTGGTLTAGSNTRVLGTEITHSRATSMTAGSVTFAFAWTAPLSEGTYSVRGAGNAVNNNRSDSGDAWALATSLTLTVSDGCEDLDLDGVERCEDGSGGDCDDTDRGVFPGATETCDGVDQDCDGVIDDRPIDDIRHWPDADGDGFGEAGAPEARSCTVPSDHATVPGDCDDSDPRYNPGAAEDCTELVDYNCDGSTGLGDKDGDGVSACEDCNDADDAVNPSGTEMCNMVDDDCDGTIDEADATDAPTWYIDADGDGWGSGSATLRGCARPAGYAESALDCNDVDPRVHPDAPEVWYDGIDQNCDTNDSDQDGDGTEHPDDCDDIDAEIITCDSGDPTGEDTGSGQGGDQEGCGCSAVPASSGLVLGLLALGAAARRRR